MYPSFVEIHGMRMVDMLGNGYITAAAMVAFLAFMDLRACILALAAIAVATVVLELMFSYLNQIDLRYRLAFGSIVTATVGR